MVELTQTEESLRQAPIRPRGDRHALLLYVFRRLGSSLVLFVLVSMVIFLLLRVAPGDPVLTKLGGIRGASPQALIAIRHDLGLDRPLSVQYVSWVRGVVFRGDLGKSYFSQYPVSTLIAQRVTPTVELTLLALFISIAAAVPAAVISAYHPGSVASRLIDALTALLMAAPPFMLGIVLVILLGVESHILPPRGYVPFVDQPWRNTELVAMPAVTLGLVIAAPLILLLRASLIETIHAPFIRTAVGKGLTWSAVVRRHALPNAFIPSLTYIGVTVGYLLGGAVVIEYVFGWPGLGSLIVDSVHTRDYGVIQSLVLLAACVFIVTTFITDLLAGMLDPRLRRHRAE